MNTAAMDTTGAKVKQQASTPWPAKLPNQRASTPRTTIKTVYWRGNVIDVVNRFFVKLKYEPVPRLVDPGWTKTWQNSVAKSIAQINAGRGRVHKSTKEFLDALDES
jgi:hypothetical protein